MSDIVNNETSEVSGKPVQENEVIKFPPFPDPNNKDFEDDIPEEERTYYKNKFKDLNTITSYRLHCSACDRHLGCSARNETRMRSHPLLRTLVCHTCHKFYNSGEFEKGDDGSELYCRWCGQGGQVYCCAKCPHVFCAKCIRRNLGNPKIKEIEELDDWKCFKCNNKCLWDLRAICWAVIRYCDLKNKITYGTQDANLKESYQKSCAQDFSECCKNKMKRKEKEIKKPETPTKKSIPTPAAMSHAAVISKIPPTIQVKKFAAISIEESKTDKKPQKRPASPKNHRPIIIRNSVSMMNKIPVPPLAKKVRMPNAPVINPVRFNNDRKMQQNFNAFTKVRPKPPQMSVMYNGYNNTHAFTNDNINLSLESLTQGLDMSTVAAITSGSNDDVVCTPDFPLEPLCEVTEDNGDDDVQCITPGPVAVPKASSAMLIRNTNHLPELSPENIIQMTENDVTVNATTGGLKFRVDPQTLSSNKMYRLPDGRIFAINANPTMPGGYSATIVAVTENSSGKASKGTTFAAKLSAITSTPVPPLLKCNTRKSSSHSPKRSTSKSSKSNKKTDTSRVCDLNVPVEWYRYNLIDAIDALEFSLTRLHQLKKNATTMHLRTRSINEMRYLHRTLERSLNTSMTRFKEIKENLNKEFKQYIEKKMNSSASDDDDDDVEILQEDDDPIFIDENSLESIANDNHEVDLTALGSSDLNESIEKSLEQDDISKTEDPLNTDSENNKICIEPDCVLEEKPEKVKELKNIEDDSVNKDSEFKKSKDTKQENRELKENGDDRNNEDKTVVEEQAKIESVSTETVCKTEKKSTEKKKNNEKIDDEDILNEKESSSENGKKSQDCEMSDDMIENLLKDDDVGNNDDSKTIQTVDISEDIQDELPNETGKTNVN